MPPNDHDWSSYSKLVLTKIEELSLDHKALSREVIDLRLSLKDELNTVCNELSSLKTKAAIWGGIAGTILGGVISQFFKYWGKQ